MRRRRLTGAALAAVMMLALFLAFAVSCNPPFSSVRITGSPSIYAPLGSRTFQMADYFAVRGLTDSLNEAMGGQGRAYDFIDASSPAERQIQKVLVHFPLAEVPLDFSAYMDDLDLGTSFDVQIPEQSFAVPPLAANRQSTLDIDVNQMVVDTANAGMEPIEIPGVLETGSPTLVTATYSGTASTTNYETVTFSGGTYRLSFSEVTGTGPGLTLTLTRIELRDGATVIAQADFAVDLLAPGGATANLPLAGLTLPGEYDVIFTVSTSNGTGGLSHTLTASASITPDTGIASATGLNFTETVALDSGVLALGIDPATFYGADIGAGTLALSLEAMPGTGFGVTVDADLVQAGGLNVPVTVIGTPISLASQHVSAADASFSGNATITATNASITVPTSGVISLDCGVAVDVTSLSSLTVIPPEPIDLHETVSEALSADVVEWVQSVHFDEVGLNVTVNNQLPGNAIGISLNAPDFGILPASQDFPSGATTTRSYLSTDYDMTIDGAIDLQMDMTLSGYDAVNNRLTFTDVAPGSDFLIGGSVEVVADWTSVTLNGGSHGAGQFPAAPIDFSEAFDLLDPSIRFTEASFYVYASGIDQSFADALDVTLSAVYSLPPGGPVSLIDPSDGITALAAGLPDPLGTPEGVYEGILPPPSMPPIDFTGVVNARPFDLRLDYLVSSGLITINRAAIQEGQSLKIDAAFIIPFKLEVTALGGAPIALEGLEDGLGHGSDLFGRTGPGDDIDDLLGMLSSMTLTAVLDNGTGIELAATLDDGAGFSKTLTTSTGRHDLALDANDIAHIRSTIPFNPALEVVVPYGSWAFRRNAALTATLSVTAVTDIDETIELGGED